MAAGAAGGGGGGDGGGARAAHAAAAPGVRPGGAAPAAAAAAAPAPAPATCPFGFGSRAGSRKLDELHCPVCAALLHEPVVMACCAAPFCAACAARARDCPACGADVAPGAAAPSEQLQGARGAGGAARRLPSSARGARPHACARAPQACGHNRKAPTPHPLAPPITPCAALVDAYLSGHGAGAALAGAQADAVGGGGGGGGGGASSFFLFHGLRSLMGVCARRACALHARRAVCDSSRRMGRYADAAAARPVPPRAGGNAGAALERLGRARALLLAELVAAEGAEATAAAPPPPPEAGAGGEPAAQLACRLGAVCGSLGDAHRARGDLAAAGRAVAESVAHLRPHAAAGDAGAAHALSVSLGKLGDLQFFRAQHAAASGGGDSGGGGGDSGAGGDGSNGGGAAHCELSAAAAALPYYEEALAARRALCGPLSGGRPPPGATLDLVAAMAKVADAHEARRTARADAGAGSARMAAAPGLQLFVITRTRAGRGAVARAHTRARARAQMLGDAAAARRAWGHAAGELHELQLSAGAALEGPAAAKMDALRGLLEARGHSGGGGGGTSPRA